MRSHIRIREQRASTLTVDSTTVFMERGMKGPRAAAKEEESSILSAWTTLSPRPCCIFVRDGARGWVPLAAGSAWTRLHDDSLRKHTAKDHLACFWTGQVA